MMKKSIWLFILVAVLAGCKTTSPQADRANHSGLSQDDAVSIKAAFHRALERFDSNNEYFNVPVALALGERLIELQPHQHEEVAKVYRIKMLDYFIIPTEEKWQELASFYRRWPSLRFFDLASPSFVRVLANSNLSQQTQQLNPKTLSWLLESILENPVFPGNRKMLADYYSDQEQFELAAYLYAGLLNQTPDNEEYLLGLANAQWSLAYDNTCAATSQISAEKAIQTLQTLVKRRPNDDFWQMSLALLYQLAGKDRLMEFTLKSVAQRDPSYQSDYAESLLWRGKVDQAQSYFDDPQYQAQDPGWYYGAMYAALMTQDWQKVISYVPEIEADEKPAPYALVYTAKVLEHLQGKDVANTFLLTNQNKYESDPWADTLYSYALGNLTPTELLGRAKDKCNVTEGHFMLALESILKEDQEAWKRHTEIVLQQEVFSFYENATARYWKKN